MQNPVTGGKSPQGDTDFGTELLLSGNWNVANMKLASQQGYMN